MSDTRDWILVPSQRIEPDVTIRLRAARPAVPIRRGGGKVGVGRNDPCPCGSGRKLKKCCLWVRRRP